MVILKAKSSAAEFSVAEVSFAVRVSLVGELQMWYLVIAGYEPSISNLFPIGANAPNFFMNFLNCMECMRKSMESQRRFTYSGSTSAYILRHRLPEYVNSHWDSIDFLISLELSWTIIAAIGFLMIISRFCGHYCILYCLFTCRGSNVNAIAHKLTVDTGLKDYLAHKYIFRFIK